MMQAKIADIPAWTYEGKEPSIYTFFESIALAGLEEKRIRLSAACQRLLLGSAVFGRRAIVVNLNGTIECTTSAAFGLDYNEAVWRANTVRLAAQAHKQLHPGACGEKYYGNWD